MTATPKWGHTVNEAEYAELLRRSPVPVVVHGDDSRVVDANQSFADLMGYTLDEVLALHAHDIIHPESRQVRDEQAKHLIDGSEQSLSVTRRLLRKDGSSLWAKVHKSSVQHDGGVVVMVFFEDWTEQRWESPQSFGD